MANARGVGQEKLAMPISARSVIQSTVAFLLVGFAVLIVIVGMTFWLGERAQVYFDQANGARDMRSAVVELRNAVQTAESGQRGFMFTGNEIYLAPYDTAKAQGQRQLGALQHLLAPFPDTEVPLQRLTAIIAEKFDEMDQTITLKRDRRDAEALALFRTNRGKALMDEANVFFSGLVRQADDRLTIGVEEQRTNAGWLRLASALGALVIVAVVGGATYVIAQYTRELRAARDEVNGLNAELEQRVARRTEDLAQARDRAEVLLSEVNHRVANSLAMVSSLISLQSRGLTDPAAKAALTETQDRIFAISLVHKRLYSSSDARVVSLDEYLAGLIDHLKTSMRSESRGTTLTADLQPIQLGTDASVNLGVIVTEWVTNAFKYAYPEGAGEIRVRLRSAADNTITLEVEDDGVGKVEGAPAKGTGLGTRIVSSMASSLGATIEYRERQPGTTAILAFAAR
jgi:two-component sensor histidine kinase/CHASE3 domain sensor protein